MVFIQDNEIRSRQNDYEAEFLLALSNHLILQGYTPSQITVLTTYKGQMFLIQRVKHLAILCRYNFIWNHNNINVSILQERRKNPRLEGMYVTAVDNYQVRNNCNYCIIYNSCYILCCNVETSVSLSQLYI